MRLNIVLRGATGDMVVVGRTVVSNGGKSVDDSSRDDDEKGANRHWYSVYFHVQLQIPVTAMISCAP